MNWGCYHGVEACTEVMRSYEHMVGASSSVPKRVTVGNKINGGGDEGASVGQRREAVGGGEVAGDVHGDEEEVSFFRFQRTDGGVGEKRTVDGYLSREEVTGAPVRSRDPVGVESRR